MTPEKDYKKSLILKIINDFIDKEIIDKKEDLKKLYEEVCVANAPEDYFKEIKKQPALLAEVFPYMEFRTVENYSTVLLMLNDIEFIKTYKESIISNQEILKPYSYEKYLVYRLMKEKMNSQEFKAIEKDFFDDCLDAQEFIKPLNSISYELNKIDYYKVMSFQTLEEMGKSLVPDFFTEMRTYHKVHQILGCEAITTVNFKKSIKITFLNYQNKDLIEKFLEKLPQIFQALICHINPESSHMFLSARPQLEIAMINFSMDNQLTKKENHEKLKNKI